MVGYKNKEYRNIGWFSANMDTILNYVPARLTAYLIVAAAASSRENWRRSWSILQRDKGKATSVNADWTISAMAGALNTQLEKQGCYILGDDHGIHARPHQPALRVMIATAVRCFGLVVVPVLAFRVRDRIIMLFQARIISESKPRYIKPLLECNSYNL